MSMMHCQKHPNFLNFHLYPMGKILQGYCYLVGRLMRVEKMPQRAKNHRKFALTNDTALHERHAAMLILVVLLACKCNAESISLLACLLTCQHFDFLSKIQKLTVWNMLSCLLGLLSFHFFSAFFSV